MKMNEMNLFSFPLFNILDYGILSSFYISNKRFIEYYMYTLYIILYYYIGKILVKYI